MNSQSHAPFPAFGILPKDIWFLVIQILTKSEQQRVRVLNQAFRALVNGVTERNRAARKQQLKALSDPPKFLKGESFLSIARVSKDLYIVVGQTEIRPPRAVFYWIDIHKLQIIQQVMGPELSIGNFTKILYTREGVITFSSYCQHVIVRVNDSGAEIDRVHLAGPPRWIAYDELTNRIIYTDRRDGCIRKCSSIASPDKKTSPALLFGSGETPPCGVAVRDDGCILMSAGKKVTLFSPKGNVLKEYCDSHDGAYLQPVVTDSLHFVYTASGSLSPKLKVFDDLGHLIDCGKIAHSFERVSSLHVDKHRFIVVDNKTGLYVWEFPSP